MTTPQDQARYQASVELAFADGAEIEQLPHMTKGVWSFIPNPLWDWPNCYYRVRQPVPKKIKFEAWEDLTGEIRFGRPEAFAMGTPHGWTRLPLLDIETEAV